MQNKGQFRSWEEVLGGWERVSLCVCVFVINPLHSLHPGSVLCTFLKLLYITIYVSLHFTIFSCKPSVMLPCVFLCPRCSDFPWIATLTSTGFLTYILEMDPFIHQSHLTVNYLSGTILLLSLLKSVR